MLFVPGMNFLNGSEHPSVVKRHVGSMPTVFRHGIGVAEDVVVLGHPQIDVVVLAPAEAFVEPANLNEPGPAVHDRGMHRDQISAQEILIRVAAKAVVAVRTKRLPVHVDAAVPAIHH